ncbi:MAG: 16S rRNA (adenine(1518)-N(6)/adenine(1519)-N(6))-dimethyltransferase RsmA, partial [Parcubacteria group bacterium]|nr:16S rRNA (adenine(1518)-N(6)/adenine(1519)-N(6))-dimethyltransferase RsmA [Parcubacteria group bacterium]
VSVQFYSKPEIVARVSKGSFYPMPKVDSAIIRLTPHPNHSLSSMDHGRFFRVVKAGFAGKRKQLANNLASAFRIPKAEMEKTLLAAGIAPTRRAETLSLGEWSKLAKSE